MLRIIWMYIFGWYLPQHRYRNSKPTCSHWSILPADNSSVFGLSKTSPRSIARTGRSAWSNTNTKKTWQIENGKGMCFPFFWGRWNLELRDSVRVLIWDSDRKKTWLNRTHCCDMFWRFTSLSSWISSWPCLPNVYFAVIMSFIYIETNLHRHHDHLISC